MLLQELQRDTNTLLNNLNATREQLETFLKVSGIDLSEVLYKQSSYNLLKDWIDTQNKLPKDLLFVSIATIDYLFSKHEKAEKYNRGEKLVCYAYDPKANNVVVCNTLYGTYYDYYFDNFTELQQDLC